MNWYAIYTKPHCEESVSLRLRDAGIEVLSPRIRSKKYYRGKFEYVIEPLFKSYIFAFFDNDTLHHMIRYGLGLDSIDALELVRGMEKEFGVVIPDAEVGRKVFQSVRTMAQYVLDQKETA